VAVDGRDGRLLDVSASVRGPTSDLTLLKASGLLERVPADLVVGGDLAYVGIGALHPGGVTPRRKPRGKPRSEEDRGYNTAFAQRRIIVEHTIGRLRSYQCLTQTGAVQSYPARERDTRSSVTNVVTTWARLDGSLVRDW
jgi:hypothetical protein